MLRGGSRPVARGPARMPVFSHPFLSLSQVEQAIEILRSVGDTAGEGAYIMELMTAMEAAKAGLTIPSKEEAKVRVCVCVLPGLPVRPSPPVCRPC